MKLLELQISALSRINFCFYELKKNPPRIWVNNVIDSNSLEKTGENYNRLGFIQQTLFNHDLFEYLNKESTTEARIMLIINYLYALLVKSKNNQISIHINHKDYEKEIEMFEKKNGEIISRIKTARDKLYAHIDLNWQEFAKQISFKDIESCIEFLNKILDYQFDNHVKTCF